MNDFPQGLMVCISLVALMRATQLCVNSNLSLGTSRRVISFDVSTRIAELETHLPVLRERLEFQQWPSKNSEKQLCALDQDL